MLSLRFIRAAGPPLTRQSWWNVVTFSSCNSWTDNPADTKGRTSAERSGSLPDRYIGQPSWKTHPDLVREEETTRGISRHEYAARRDQLMRRLAGETQPGTSHLLVLRAASVTFSAPDVPHQFRQDSNFFYLTGFHEPDSVLVLRKDGESGKCESMLFVAGRDQHKELWEGPRAGVDGASALTGVDGVYEKGELENVLRAYQHGRMMVWRSPAAPLDQRISGLTMENAMDPNPIMHQLRWVKSPAEIALLRLAGGMGAEAMAETMRFSGPNVRENVLAGKMDLECRIRGADCLAYPPVVAGGARANVIHYLNNDQRISGQENLVLMDAGCEVGGYVSDITRTWPVTGRFTDPQRVLYQLVYDVQTELLRYLASVRPVTLRDAFLTMMQLLALHMGEAGILRNADGHENLLTEADRLCPHHVSHYLGMDVHDVEFVPKNVDLRPGVVITVEPGVYIRPDDPNVKEEFRGYGIRIEDDVVITENGIEVLTEAAPKSISDIERTVGDAVAI